MNELEWLNAREDKALLCLKNHVEAAKVLAEELEVIRELKGKLRTTSMKTAAPKNHS